MILWWLLLSISLCWAGCPTDITCEKEFNKCYKFVDENKDFFSAEEKCLELGGHLVSLSNAFEKALVQDAAESMFLGASDYWIGANHIEADTWTWTDGSKWIYTSWSPGEPSGLEVASAAVKSGQWSSTSQDSRKPFVCGLPFTSQAVSAPPTCPVCSTTTSCPKMTVPTPAPMKFPCEDGWVHLAATKSCYKIIRNQTWTAAESLCKALGADLASIHSKTENDFLADFTATGMSVGWNDQPWIGLHQVSGIWRWSDLTVVDYVNWSESQLDPGYHPDYCAQLLPDVMDWLPFSTYYWMWNDRPCDPVVRAAICKKREM